MDAKERGRMKWSVRDADAPSREKKEKMPMNKYDIEKKQCRRTVVRVGGASRVRASPIRGQTGPSSSFPKPKPSATHSPIHSPARLVASAAEYPTHPLLSKSPRYSLVRTRRDHTVKVENAPVWLSWPRVRPPWPLFPIVSSFDGGIRAVSGSCDASRW